MNYNMVGMLAQTQHLLLVWLTYPAAMFYPTSAGDNYATAPLQDRKWYQRVQIPGVDRVDFV